MTQPSPSGLPFAPLSTPPRKRPGALGLFFRNANAVIGLVILATVALAAALAPVLFTDGPFDMVAMPLQWPFENPDHPLGTDGLGRDLLTGLIYGGRVSLVVGISATALCLVFGVTIGAIAGYAGGLTDEILSRITEFFQTIPNFLFIVVLVAIIGPSLSTIAFAIGVVSWPGIARLVRSECRAIKARDFVMAARSVGASDLRILLTEVLPNALPAVIVTASVMVATAILTESALSFMGLGDPNQISWGTMIGTGRDFLRTDWFLTAVPGAAIVLTVLALNLIGDGLNDALSPRSRDR